MKHKTLARVAVIMVIVFLVTIVVYPMIFSPEPAPTAVPPVPATDQAPAGH